MISTPTSDPPDALVTTNVVSSPDLPARPTRGYDVIRWIEAHCRFTTGQWAGEPFRLLPWQKRLILELFELGPDGRRRYRWAYVQTPKKSGKTETAAALALWFLIGDGEPSPLVVCAAASDDQADLVFNAAKRMSELSPTLSAVTERYDREILVPSLPGAKLKRVAAAAGTNDGQNISAVIADELHEWTGPKGEAVWNVLTNGTGARRQPMVFQITTPGFDLDTVAGQQYEYALAVQRGEVDDRRFYSFLAGAPDGADWRDPAIWEAANPSYGVTVQREFFEDQAKKKTESVFRRYFLGQWVAAETLWLPIGAWDACRSTVGLDPKLPLYVGIDMASTEDTTAVVMAQNVGERTVVRARFWANPYPHGDSRRHSWHLDVDEVSAYLRELRVRFPEPATRIDGRNRPGPAFGFDPWAMRYEAERLALEGLSMIEFHQNDARMVPAATTLYDLVVSGRLAHDGDPTLAWHIGNVVPRERGEHSWRITRGSPSRKIDGAIAAAMAVHQAQQPAPARRVASFLA
jgi:phage terminase large subunit-like protein